jgi:dipeptidase E
MKTLLLTSAGIKVPIIKNEVLKLLSRPVSRTKLAHIITASKAEENTDYVDKDKKVMEKTGFQVTDIDIEGKGENQLRKILEGQDIIYVQGGSGFYLLKHIRKSGFDRVVKKLLDKGVIYIGVSAGSYVACPTIEMHTWKGKERNQYGITDMTAMNLVPFLVSVHYNRKKYRKGVKAGAARTEYPVKVLNDDQAILVKNNKVKLIGKGKEIKIK